MKPTPQISSLPPRSRHDHATLRGAPLSPLTSYNFQPMIGKHSGGGDSPNGVSASGKHQSFRDISRKFLKEEMSRSFYVELFLFGVIILISAWPLFALVEALAALPG